MKDRMNLFTSLAQEVIEKISTLGNEDKNFLEYLENLLGFVNFLNFTVYTSTARSVKAVEEDKEKAKETIEALNNLFKSNIQFMNKIFNSATPFLSEHSLSGSFEDIVKGANYLKLNFPDKADEIDEIISKAKNNGEI